MQEIKKRKRAEKELFKKDLKRCSNLKATFNKINQHLYGKLKHTDTDTRTRSKEIINLLSCKLIDEVSKKPEDPVEFCIRRGEDQESVARRIKSIFENQVKKRYSSVINENEHIMLNDELIFLIVKELEEYSLLNSSTDVLKDAFEAFVGKILKEEKGQFFTPSNIIKFMVNYLKSEMNSKILDPACGHGGFLLEVNDYLWNKCKSQGINSEKERELKKRIVSNLYGIDKDLFLARTCKLYLEILSGGNAKIFCEDSLDPVHFHEETKNCIKNDEFDIIMTNPPFGKTIPIDDKKILRNYELAHSWINKNNGWEKQDILSKKQPPQILFIERCIQLLKEEGKLGIILPEGLFGNPTDRYIWHFLKKNGKILGIISLDQNTFQPYTRNKASVLFFQKIKNPPRDYEIDFAIVENVGHDKDGKILYKLNKNGTIKRDSSGKPLINDDLIDLHKKIRKAEPFDVFKQQKIFKLKLSQIKNDIFIPNYYISVEKTLQFLNKDKNFMLLSFRELIKKKIIYATKNGNLPRGDEIGSKLYGLGDIPFIRTSDFFNWEINLNSNKKTSEEVYNMYKEKQNIEPGDILLVKDGSPHLIGKTAFVTELDTKIIIQSHIYQIKVLKNDMKIDPYLLLYLLNLEVVQKQFQAITFIQGTIATIGNRIMEIIIPIPADPKKREKISQRVKEIIDTKTRIRKKILNLSLEPIF
ncbi:MAG: N-6 DNA methylase [Promethearchaeota archaeon]